jgi:Zn-dependent protease with chaperone function
MKMSSDARKAISLILMCLALLCFLLGTAARNKMYFRGRAEGSRIGFAAAGVFAGAGIAILVFSRSRERS